MVSKGVRSLLLSIALSLPEQVSLTSAGTLQLKSQALPANDESIATQALTASEAAESARQAAQMAKSIARHSIKMTKRTQAALKTASQALHGARVETEGLSQEQQEALQAAEEELEQTAEHAQYDGGNNQADSFEERALQEKLEELKGKLERQHKRRKTEFEQMHDELKQLRQQIKDLNMEGDMKESLDEIDRTIDDLEKHHDQHGVSTDEVKAAMESLRDAVKRVAEKRKQESMKGKKKEGDAAPLKTTGENTEQKANEYNVRSVDVDINMPYGDMEPFGREDTAQELTEASIRESDAMVDQLERAEVAEEKRSVFRALTRLRGAAITSFDGIARGQTGNIDEFARVNKWREAHPVKHLAQEESDVSKWAFPNADIQTKTKGHVSAP
mmetsp:Transcript_32476/g.62714  ORF Transcript_32476/g.62714 Transcript_32476/m.62714 type:complete len:388 (-) Transcript_32476:46-1209(-)